MNADRMPPTEPFISENEEVRYFNIRNKPYQGIVVAVLDDQCWVVKHEMRTVDRVHRAQIFDNEGMKSYSAQEWSHHFENIDDMPISFTDDSVEVHKKVKTHVQALLLILDPAFDRNSIVP